MKKIPIFFLIFIFNNTTWSQSIEKYQFYIIKKEKLENGETKQIDIFIDSLGIVKSNLNIEINKIDCYKLNQCISLFMFDENIEKFETGKYEHRQLLSSNLPGENINIYLSKVSDLKNQTEKNKTYYYYYKFYPFDEEIKNESFDFELYFNIPELKNLFKLLH